MAGDIDFRKSTSRYLFMRGSSAMVVQTTKMCGFVYYKSRIHYRYKSLQGDVVDEEVLSRIGFEAE